MDSVNLPRPLGAKSYGRMHHLPGSRLGPAERHLPAALATRLTISPQPGDRVWVQEKLDGTNVAVARIGDELVALTRAGYRAADSRRLQGRLFDAWTQEHRARFLDVLRPGERVVGEWLYHAHGTRYVLPHEPFVAFDLMRGQERTPLAELTQRLGKALVLPALHAQGPHEPSALFITMEGHGGHGAVPGPEGLIYRLECGDRVEVVAKWVRPDYVEGLYFKDDEAVLPNAFRPEDERTLTDLLGRLGPTHDSVRAGSG